MRLYGNLTNRLEENKEFCDKIEVGTGMTEYFYSDRHAYEVIKVIDQKHVIVREYDHELDGACYSNNWKLISNPSNPEILMVKRGNRWYHAVTVTKEQLEELENSENPMAKHQLVRIAVNGYSFDTIKSKGKQTKYYKKNVSFGVADYHYDYSF